MTDREQERAIGESIDKEKARRELALTALRLQGKVFLFAEEEQSVHGFMAGHGFRDEEVAAKDAEIERLMEERDALSDSVKANKKEWADRGYELLTAADYYYEVRDLREKLAAQAQEIERLRERERRLVASGKYALDAISKYYFSDPDSTLDALDQLRAEVDQ